MSTSMLPADAEVLAFLEGGRLDHYLPGEPYFWSAHADAGAPKLPFRVPPSFTSLAPESDQSKELTEVVFEEVRKEKYPNRPSRVGAVFVCPDISGFCRPKKGIFANIVYNAVVRGHTFQADAEMFTEANAWMNRVLMRGGSMDDAVDYVESYAESYWEAKMPASFFPEVIVQGTVIAISEVKP